MLEKTRKDKPGQKSHHSLFYLVCFYPSYVAISVDMTA